MNVKLECIYCCIKKVDSLFNQYEKDKHKKLEFMKKVFNVISKSEEGDTSPYLYTRIMRLLNSELKLGDIYYDIKKEYNKLLMNMEDEIMNNIHNSEDKLLTALKYAMVGNFIDFGAMDKVDTNKLKDLIDNASKQKINDDEYNKFLEELKNAKNIVYLLDNSGEIVFDKIFIKLIKEMYPDLIIDVIVRGKPALNDATIIDAEEIGLCNIVNVIGNGTDISGTQLNKINLQTKEKIDKADFIISKGQGNFESLFGSGKNIYYIFLCKCDLFTKRFNMQKFQGIFINERNVKIVQ